LIFLAELGKSLSVIVENFGIDTFIIFKK